MDSIKISTPIQIRPKIKEDRKYYYKDKGEKVSLVYDGKLVKNEPNKLVFEHLSDSDCKFYTIYDNIAPNTSLNKGSSYIEREDIGKSNDGFNFYISKNIGGSPVDDISSYFSGSKECETSKNEKEDKNKKKSTGDGNKSNVNIGLPNLLNPYFMADIPTRVAFGGLKTLKDLLLKKEGVEDKNQILEEIERIKQLMK